MNVWVSAVTSIIAAMLVSGAAYISGWRLGRHQAQLNHVNRQLAELYGPLLARVESSGVAWRSFLAEYRPGSSTFFEGHPRPTDEELQAWFDWMEIVLLPSVRVCTEIVLHKTDLFDDESLPEPVITLLAHAAAYEVVAAQWSRGDRTTEQGLVDFPEQLPEYLQEGFASLKKRQRRLLKSTRRRWLSHG